MSILKTENRKLALISLTVLIGTAVFGLANQAQASFSWAGNLAAHYKMNDNDPNTTTVINSKGLPNGTAQQNTSVLHDPNGKVGGALSFNGTSDCINSNNTFNALWKNDFSLNFWMNFSGATEQEQILADVESGSTKKFSAASVILFSGVYPITDYYLDCFLTGSTGNLIVRATDTTAYSTRVPSGWAMVTITARQNGANVELKGYINNSQIFSETASGNLSDIDSSGNLFIGAGGSATSIGKISSLPVGSATIGLTPYQITVVGDYLYVIHSGLTASLQIFDISNPAAPSLAGEVALVDGDPTSVSVLGNYAYVVGDDDNTLEIYDISNLSSIVKKSSITIANEPDGIFAQGNYVYIINSGESEFNPNKLTIYNVSNPAAPTLSGSISTQADEDPSGVFVSGSYAYVVNNTTLQVFNVSNPAVPTLSGSISTGAGSNPTGLFVQDNYAYVTYASSNKLAVIDISNKALPSVVGVVSTGAHSSPRSVFVQGSYAYVANFDSATVQAYDVSNPASPTLINSIIPPSAIDPVSLYVKGRYLFEIDIDRTTMNIFSLGAPVKAAIDDVMIFNKALSQDEITGLYNSGNGVEDTTPPTNVGISSITANSTVQLTVTADTATDPESGLHTTPYYFDRDNGTANSGWQASTVWTDTGLSPNTQYTYKVKARNGEGSESDYSTAMSAYTLAPTPTHLTATTINYNSITLTVDALPNATLDSSGYYFSRSGGGNSGWIRTNTWHDTGLTCGISYTYSVKYQNGDGVPTGSISIDTSTTSCTYDTDEDGMPDTWETQYGLNPNDPSDASQDADNDGWTNLQEYQLGYDPNNASPVKPVGIFPSGDEVSLTPTLEGSAYSDSELDPHISTQWQIAYDIDFSELTFDDTTTIDTQTIQMPLAILTPVTTYYWRVRYSDATGWSAWSDAVKFITENLDDFLDETEGIDTTDVVGSDIGTVTQAYRQSPDNFSDLPSGYQFYNGIFSFRIEDITPGDTVAVTFQLDEPLKQGDKWLKYYPNSREWDTAYGDTHILNGVGTSEVTLEFKDGGFGDIDGVANGVIVDPSGPGEIDIGNTYTISGQVTLTGAPTNVTSVFLALNGDTSEKTSGQVCAPTDVTSVLLTLNGDTSETIYPDADGNYSFVDLKGGNYTVTPSLEGYHFYPVSYSYTLLDSDQIEQDFVGVYITSSGGGGGGKGHCFIVTATFGTPMAEEVMVLSQFRDKYLLTNPIGKGFVSTYYKVSPSIADFIREHPLLKKVVRGALSPLIWFSGEMTE